ncbi:uncharacterized protein LOC126735351 [Anthonomus grandis grandis]|uniref:uncharacterized protein LOC126735351 n=1 Tax=Anthonomus grandis grandis TaxID=2921223 RepID=UPI002165D6F8|nr:uncharacterized protein LOC126735351 [Anthonomus grandis grandis]
MKSQFIEQVQLLMETQHIKYTESFFGKPNNYMWLCTKKPHMVYWMSTKDEIKIRNCLNKITQEQEIKILKQVLNYLDRNPESSPHKVPEITQHFLNEAITTNFLKKSTEEESQPFSRLASFRNSLRKLGSFATRRHLGVPEDHTNQRRSVTFADMPTVYRISVGKN